MGEMVKVDPIVVGTVKDLRDPLHLGRVRVSYGHLGEELSNWARLAAPGIGQRRGILFRPEVDDEVLIALLQGSADQPYVIGGLWNEEDPPPEGGGEPANDLRTIQSRSGHIVRFDDTPGSERIEVRAASGTREVVIDDANGLIQVRSDDGRVVVSAGRGDVEIAADSDITVRAGGSLALQASDISIAADNTVSISGTTVRLN